MTAAVVLALVAAVGWGASDFLGGVRSRAMGLLPVLLGSQVVALLLVGGFAAAAADTPPAYPYLLAAAAAGAAEAVGVGALYRGLALGRASAVAPMAAAAPVVPLVASMVLGQVPGPVQLTGLAVVVAGLVLAAHERRTLGTHTGRAAPGVLLGALSAAGFGAYFVLIDTAGDGDVPWALLISRLTAVALITGIVLLTRARVLVTRRDLPVLALIGALIVVADAGYAVAALWGHLGVAAVLAALHPLVTIGLAAAVLGERIDPVQRAGVTAAVLGIVAITAGAG